MTAQISRGVARDAGSLPGADRVVLDYEGRFLRRKRLVTASGAALLVDPHGTAPRWRRRGGAAKPVPGPRRPART